eukprot:scaffold487868_cov38-Prasinocladus_malaysianus.AAC.2
MSGSDTPNSVRQEETWSSVYPLQMALQKPRATGVPCSRHTGRSSNGQRHIIGSAGMAACISLASGRARQGTAASLSSSYSSSQAASHGLNPIRLPVTVHCLNSAPLQGPAQARAIS